jgi:hypothetical protein
VKEPTDTKFLLVEGTYPKVSAPIQVFGTIPEIHAYMEEENRQLEAVGLDLWYTLRSRTATWASVGYFRWALPTKRHRKYSTPHFLEYRDRFLSLLSVLLKDRQDLTEVSFEQGFEFAQQLFDTERRRLGRSLIQLDCDELERQSLGATSYLDSLAFQLARLLCEA